MKVRLLKPWGNPQNRGRVRPAGAEMLLPDGVAEMWIARGRAERVTDDPTRQDETSPLAVHVRRTRKRAPA